MNKIVLAVMVFGFVASSALAMENLEKLTANDRWTEVFLLKGTRLRYLDPAWVLVGTFIKLPPQLQRYRCFGTKFTIEKAIAEKNFVSCNFPGQEKAILCGTTDEKECYRVKNFFRIQEMLAAMPDIYDAEGYDRYGNKCSGGE